MIVFEECEDPHFGIVFKAIRHDVGWLGRTLSEDELVAHIRSCSEPVTVVPLKAQPGVKKKT